MNLTNSFCAGDGAALAASELENDTTAQPRTLWDGSRVSVVTMDTRGKKFFRLADAPGSIFPFRPEPISVQRIILIQIGRARSIRD